MTIDRSARLLVASAAGCWAATLAGRTWGTVLVVACGTLGLVAVALTRRAGVGLVAALLVAGSLSGHLSAEREQAVLELDVPAGPYQGVLRLTSDPAPGRFGWWALAVADPPEPGRPPAAPMLVAFDGVPAAGAGETVAVAGRRRARSGYAGGDPYAGVVAADVVDTVDSPKAPWWTVGNAVRRRAVERLDGSPARGLLAGFLVGETGGVPAADIEAMRRSGLSHFVAVSGSNVALFLMLTFVALGPLASGPRRRAVTGLVALVVLVIATRWEGSVLRASVMAALVLGGRLAGVPLDGWSALSTAVIVILIVSGQLATDLGFALSVAATAGVLASGALGSGSLPRPLTTAATATLGAQAAVAPILLAAFGTIPLLAPLANLVAAPLVAASTTVGAVGVALGWEPLIRLAAAGAGAVLWVARLAAPWPQVGAVGTAVVAAGAVVARSPRLRPAVVAVGALGLVWVVLVPGYQVDLPSAVVLDVGQGDAILVLGPAGESVLVDGGPEPAILEAKLVEHGVDTLDLVVLTHVHADHASGLEAVIGRRTVGMLWAETEPHRSAAADLVMAAARAAGVPVRSPPVGHTVQLGGLVLEVLGPLRRYDSPNDQSVVLRVSAGGPRLLLTGDVELVAQGELEGVSAELLKVPHQGGATSDLDWLEAVGADLAVISVGPNDYGHPDPAVVAGLEEAGTEVRRTDLEGDVVLPLR